MKLQFILGRPIVTTNFNKAKPLGMNGQLILENWHILYDLLKKNVGPECAALLLEPQLDRGRGEVDWYLPVDSQNLPVKHLSKEENLKEAYDYIEEGKKYAQYLINSPDSLQKQKGKLLLDALQFPNDEFIIATPHGPAILEWGHESNQPYSKKEVLSAKGKERNMKVMTILPPPVSPFNNRIENKNFWPWITSGLILLLLMILPWWKGIISINYCRYYWLLPLVLFFLTLLVVGVILKKQNDLHSLVNKE